MRDIYVVKKILRVSSVLLFSVLFYVVSVPASSGIPITDRYVVIVILGLVLMASVRNIPTKISIDIFNFLWFSLIVIVFISSLYNKIAMSGVVNTVLIYILYFQVMAKNMNSLCDVSIGLIVFGDVLLAECLQTQGLVMFWYRGIMENPNQLGVTLVAPFVACLYFAFSEKYNNKYVNILIIANALFFLFILWCTSCRSGLLACVISLFIIGRWKINTLDFARNKLVFLNVMLSVVMLIVILNADDILAFISKTFIYKYGSATSDISSDRYDMWKQVLSESRAWGYGHVYLACHNDFFAYVQKYGWIFSFLLYFYIALTVAVLPRIKGDKWEKIFCGIYIVSCVIVSLFEEIISMFGKPLVMMMFISMGLIVKEYRRRRLRKEW